MMPTEIHAIHTKWLKLERLTPPIGMTSSPRLQTYFDLGNLMDKGIKRDIDKPFRKWRLGVFICLDKASSPNNPAFSKMP
jgi:hypothetical protein